MAVKKEGATLTVTFRVRWLSPVTFSVVATQDQRRCHNLDCSTVTYPFRSLGYCKKYRECADGNKFIPCDYYKPCILKACRKNQYERVCGQVTGKLDVVVTGMAVEGEIEYDPKFTDPEAPEHTKEKPDISAIKIKCEFLPDGKNENLDRGMGYPSKALEKAISSDMKYVAQWYIFQQMSDLFFTVRTSLQEWTSTQE